MIYCSVAGGRYERVDIRFKPNSTARSEIENAILDYMGKIIRVKITVKRNS